MNKHAWISWIEDSAAEGALKSIYSAAKRRAGKVFNILRVMSLNPPQLQASMGLYGAVMHGKSELTRAERELVATVVSSLNACNY